MSDDLSYLLDVCTLSPLLTAEQEIMYGKRIQAGIALTDPVSEHYAPNPTKQQKRVIQSGLRAQKAMVNANLRLVVSVAKKYSRTCHLHHLTFGDLVQEGVIGLTRGVQKFDASRGYKFSTFGYWWIRQSITRSIAVYDRTIRLPIGCSDVFGKLNRFVPEFVVEHSRQPSVKEQADHVGCSVDALQYYLAHLHGVGSLDAPAKAMVHEPGSKLLDLIANTHTSGEASLDKLETDVDYSVLSKTMLQLEEKERLVLEHRYQLGGADFLTLAQVGEKIGVCRERVRQIETRAIRKLRGYMRYQPINFRTTPIPVSTYTEQLELEVAA